MGGSKNEHFSCFHTSCQTGLKAKVGGCVDKILQTTLNVDCRGESISEQFFSTLGQANDVRNTLETIDL